MNSCPSCDKPQRIPKGAWERAKNALEALSARRVPTQQQLDAALKALLSSNLLRVDNTASGTLSAHGQSLMLNVRAILEAVARIGMEKNADNLVQDVIWQCHLMSAVPVQVNAHWHNQSKMDIGVDATMHYLNGVSGVKQTEATEDYQALISSLRTLLSLLFTSSEFRLLLSDILVATRQIIADIEERLAKESPDKVKQTIVERVEAVVLQVQGNPTYQALLGTLVALGEKYANLTVQATDSAVAATPSATDNSTVQPSASIDPNPHLKRLLEDIRTLLERFAGGYSLSPLGDSMKQFLEHLSQDETSGVSDLLHDAKLWLRKALETPGWLTTRTARKELDALYDRIKAILDGKPSWRTDLQKLSAEASAFSDHLERDPATEQLLGAIDALGACMRSLGAESVRNVDWKKIRAGLWRDAVGWLLPRLLAILEVVPLPPVERKDDTLNLVVDDVSFRAPPIPDHVRGEKQSEGRVEGGIKGENWAVTVEGDSVLRVHIDGLRITAHEIDYTLHLEWGWLGYDDTGLFCIDIGHESGLILDLELETDLGPSAHSPVTPDSGTPPPSFFRIRSATVEVPGVDFTLGRSDHWVLNACMLPFRNRTISHGLSTALSQSINEGLEVLDRKLGEMYAQAKEETSAKSLTDATSSQPGIWDWWNALLKGRSAHSHDAKGESAHAADKVETKSNVELGRKGWESSAFDL